MIRSQFLKRGIDIAVREGTVIDEPIVPRVVTDVERRLKWLRETVQPVVRALYEAGYEAEAADALYGWLLPSQQ